MLDRSRIEFRLGPYGAAPGVSLEDPRWLPRVQAYRRQLGARMVACDRGSASRVLPGGEFFVSRKIDGEFNAILYRAGEICLVNPGGTVRVGMPVLEEAADLLKKAGVGQAMIPAELYVRRRDGKRARVHDVSRFARRPREQEQVERLCLAPFDLIEIDGEDWLKDYDLTWDWLSRVFGEGERIRPVETEKAEGARGVLRLFERWVEEEGSEGVVARSDQGGWFKIKPRHTLDVVVIGFAEGTDDRAGLLHDLLLGIYRADGAVHVLGRVGGGFTDEQRRDYLSDLREMVVESEYTEINSDRVAYEMVRPEWVAEISCLDLISHTTRGATIDRMVLEWIPGEEDEGGGRWRTTRRLPLCSVISPQFVRLRDDKQPGPEDCRFSQITDVVDIEMADATSEDLQLPRSEILRREVRVKETKGGFMVRKLLLWKTNKEEITRGEYPAYVVHLTDFSPNRKEAMKPEIRVSDSREQIERLYTELAESAFVRGWVDPAEGEDESGVEPARESAGKETSVKKKSPARKSSPAKQANAPSGKKPTVKRKTGAKKAAPAKKKTASGKKSAPKKRGPAAKKSASEKRPAAKKKSAKKRGKKS